ncbi:recombinase family protein [Fictibacillus sp. S7]|uniref:recombinase family protein n=1 Tax=Fictibacillus sp. S7 TaxID=2212476 RepID=UPI0013E90A40|nr:recombinase family protein [Fictibacillus sp. S7]
MKKQKKIGDMLYEKGIIPKRKESKNFGASSIFRILTSEIYIGLYVYNKRKGKKV